jgi:hypothetical protein
MTQVDQLRLEAASRWLEIETWPEQDRSRQPRFDPTRDISLNWNWSSTSDSEGNPVASFSLKGLSGSGIWRLGRGTEPSRASSGDIRLVGITHDVTTEEIRGTNMSVALALIRNHCTDLRAAIDLAVDTVNFHTAFRPL